MPVRVPGDNPFGDHIGLEFTVVGEGYSECELEVTNDLRNPFGVLHGGVLYSMADTGMGAALYSELSDEERCATVECSISYFTSVADGTVTCETRVVDHGGSVSHLESTIYRVDEHGDRTQVGRATGTYYVSRKRET